ncbi:MULTISPECIES: hypothetical protein [Nitrosomonas]|uniref:Uncharacterized protein n=1 Tax=Nitrosomonas communis TaxID=44574 RepID=A0A5D3Y9N8_9PROT|nr:hypothetical protein BCL69_105223 [Nitrosomonas communis]
MRDFFSSEIEILTQMLIQQALLFLCKRSVAAASVVSLQGSQTAFTLSLEVIAYRFTVNQQGVCNPGDRPPLPNR